MLFLPILFGCSKETQMKKELIGEWYQSYYNRVEPTAGGMRTQETNYDKIDTPELLIFNENGTYERIFRYSKERVMGVWTLSDNCHELTFTRKDENGFINLQRTNSISFDEGVIRLYSANEKLRVYIYKEYRRY